MRTKRIITLILALAITFSLASTVGFAEEPNKGSLVAHYKFDDDFKDASGNKLDAELEGDVPFVESLLGKAAQFGDGYLTVKDNDLLDFDKAFSVSMWVRSRDDADKANLSGLRTLLIKGGNKYSPYQLFLNSSDTIVGEFDGNDYNTSRISAKKRMDLIAEKWYLYTVTYSDGKVSVYYDDKFIQSGNVAEQDKVLKKTEGALYIGNNPLSQFQRNYYGCIDDLKIYNYALSVDEVKKTYNDVIGKYSGKIELQVNNPKMTVNGVVKEIDPGRGTKPIGDNNRTLVPIASVVQAMGGTVTWVGKDKRVDIKLKDKKIQLWIDKLDAKVNGVTKQLDIAPTSKNNRTLVPLKFVVENLGAIVEWNETSKKFIIRYKR